MKQNLNTNQDEKLLKSEDENQDKLEIDENMENFDLF